MSKAKRRWWLAEERFVKVYRRLKRNYTRTLVRGEIAHRENEAALKRKLLIDEAVDALFRRPSK